jgi:hypothetical protein
MRDEPDSMLAAAKKVAAAARIPWGDVHKVYRTLQPNFIPISRGRSIHYAQPDPIASLIIGLLPAVTAVAGKGTPWRRKWCAS